ncbi:MAG: helix-turn-helix domain-containing protein [Chloroflexi bacterium]|nr:helix-turn-helix domain-containing protein [Chloroflexota bacterium]
MVSGILLYTHKAAGQRSLTPRLDACRQNVLAQVKQGGPGNAATAGSAVGPVDEDEYLTTDEVARRLRVHPTTILRRLGAMDDADPARIPAVRVGRVWRIPRREFEEWLTRSGQAQRLAGRQRRLF